jgi:hypothetical protein
MATQREEAILNVVINGEQAITSFRELNRQRTEQLRLVQSLNRNSPEYAQQQRRLEDLNAAHRAWRQEINNDTAALDRLGDQMEETGKSSIFDKMKSMFSKQSFMIAGGNLIADGISSAIGAVKDFVNGSEAAYAEAVKGQAQLDAALKSTAGIAGQTKDSLNDMATALMNQTGVDDDVISKSEQMLLTFTNIRGKIYEQALPAIVDMTSAMNQGQVTMEGIQATSIQVGKALNDPIKGVTALAKVGVAFTEQQKEQIKTLVESNHMMDAQAMILKELQKEFGGTAKAIADTDAGQLQSFETRLGNIQEGIGGIITKIKAGFSTSFSPFLDWLEKATTTPLAETIQGEQVELNSLVGAIVSCNDNQAVRNRLIQDLQTKYPDFLGNIKAEDVANDMLQRRLKMVNEQYQQRISMAVNQEALTDAQKKYNQAIRDQADARKVLAEVSGKSIAELSQMDTKQLMALSNQTVKKYQNRDDDEGMSRMVGAAQARELLQSSNKVLAESYKDITDLQGQAAKMQAKFTEQRIAGIDKEIAALTKKKQAEKDVGKAQADQAEIDRLTQQKNILLGNADGAPQSGPSDDTLKKRQAAREKAAKELQDYKKQLTDARAEVDKFFADATKGTSNNLDAQLKLIDDKYKKLIDKLKTLNKNKFASDDEKAANRSAIIDLEGQSTKEKDDARASVFYQQGEKTINDGAEDQLNQAKDALAERAINEKEFADKEFTIEQERLSNLYDLRTVFGMQTLDLESKIADGRIKNEKRAYEANLAQIKREAKSEQDYLRIKQDIENQKGQLANTGAQLLIAAFGKSKGVLLAQLAIEKAIAIGRIIANEGIEIAGYYATPQSILSFGAAALPAAIAAHVRAGLSIANIVATGLLEGASIVSSYSGNKKYAKGGLLPDGPGHNHGGLKLVDPYGMIYGEVEGGEPIISRETYKNNRSLVDALLGSGGKQLNYSRVQEATINRERRVSTAQPIPAQAPQSAGIEAAMTPLFSNLNGKFEAMLVEMRNMSNAFQDQEIILSTRTLEKHNAKVAKIRDDANA